MGDEVTQPAARRADPVTPRDGPLHVSCPHCGCLTEIEAVNCGIFRHAAWRSNNQPINPHSSRQECERVVREGLVWGCAMPFRLTTNVQGQLQAVACDFI